MIDLLVTKVENKYGEQLNITNDPDYVVSITGLTPAGATINTSKIVNVDGTKFNSSSMNERNIVLMITPRGNIEKSRIKLYKYFKVKQYIKLYFRNDSRDVYIEGYVETIEGDLFTKTQQIQISVICPNPFFKDMKDILYRFSNTTSSFEFEFAIDEAGVPVSEATNFTELNVINTSDDETGIIIELTANDQVLEPTIYNQSTGDSFTIEFEMVKGDVIRLNTAKGNKTLTLIRGGAETNIINKMKKGSKWFNLNVGDNIFTYSCIYGDTNLNLQFILEPIYEGV